MTKNRVYVKTTPVSALTPAQCRALKRNCFGKDGNMLWVIEDYKTLEKEAYDASSFAVVARRNGRLVSWATLTAHRGYRDIFDGVTEPRSKILTISVDIWVPTRLRGKGYAKYAMKGARKLAWKIIQQNLDARKVEFVIHPNSPDTEHLFLTYLFDGNKRWFRNSGFGITQRIKALASV